MRFYSELSGSITESNTHFIRGGAHEVKLCNIEPQNINSEDFFNPSLFFSVLFPKNQLVLKRTKKLPKI